MPIPVIDLFAGPGGLSEGFSSLFDGNDRPAFDVKLSVEKDPVAHSTLELRAFFRHFSAHNAPDTYYEYLRGNLSHKTLFDTHPDAARQASSRAWLAELGKVADAEVDRRISTALGKEKDRWVLIGGPPCQAYSLMRRWRQGKKDEDFDGDKKHFLYQEYLRVIAEHRPPVFVMENVKGLLSTTVRKERIFDRILEDLRHPMATQNGKKEDLEYKFYPLIPTIGEITGELKPSDFIIRAENFGIPQARHRIIILGVRSDWKHRPGGLLSKSKAIISVKNAIGDLPPLRSGLSKEPDSPDLWQRAVREICSSKYLTNEKVTDKLFRAIMSEGDNVDSSLNRGGSFLNQEVKPEYEPDWFSDPKLKGICSHETRSHIRSDLHRYFFAAVFGKEIGRSPVLDDFPKRLLPNHGNVNDEKFGDRFRVQLSGRPSTTVVSHISRDGHYYIHYDPTQCRSLTVREAARLQTFPDNYFFQGPRTQQYQQVGNAVPPLLARQIAKIVAGLF
jgi:DNA (cytosine-5)-methyltransferase 1